MVHRYLSGDVGSNADPNGVPNNLIPFMAQVAVGLRPHLNVFGADYDTPIGAGVRDYVHVMDVAAGHLRALECLETQRLIKVNHGSSVLQFAHAFSKASGKDIPSFLRLGVVETLPVPMPVLTWLSKR